jgi:murein DD-endopeptidase MepM/ murein hydrolase activator NlpD
MQSFIGLDKGFHVSSPFSEYDSAHYDEFRNYHYGLDLGKGGIAGDSVYAGISGIVDDKGWNTGVNGNDLRIEYAFKYEGNTIGTGIYGEYMHMLTKSPLIKGSYVSGNMLAGQVGSTGSASSAAHFALRYIYDWRRLLKKCSLAYSREELLFWLEFASFEK